MCTWCENNKIAKKVFSTQVIKWAYNVFEPHKSHVYDVIFPVLMQKAISSLAPHILALLRTSYKLGYIPHCCVKGRVVLISETGIISPREDIRENLMHLYWWFLECLILPCQTEHIKYWILFKTELKTLSLSIAIIVAEINAKLDDKLDVKLITVETLPNRIS